jgi:hypothetical protein
MGSNKFFLQAGHQSDLPGALRSVEAVLQRRDPMR